VNNTRTRIKICGITRPEDGLLVADCGGDAIGLNFYSGSPRFVSIEQAQDIVSTLPAFVSIVGLFVNAEVAAVKHILNSVPLDILQFHGDEDESYCKAFSRPYLKAIRVRPEMDIKQAIQQFPSAKGILLDAWHRDIVGGTGESFDWSLLDDEEQNSRITLAGGLDPTNVAEAIRQVRPYAVDVSSGVEIEPGLKSKDKIIQFVNEVLSEVMSV
jgi:phosphoribosylanthranilate isomerase